MLATFGERFSRLAQRWVPDPFVLALLLTLIALLTGLIFTGFELDAVIRDWSMGRAKGFWSLLTFAMQMCLILVTGHALAESPPVAKGLDFLADRVRSPAAAIAVVAVVAMVFGLVNWGLGLIAGALLARKVGQRARAQGIAIHYPLVVAAGYTGLLVWHGGLSGSAPLKVTLAKDLVEILGEATAQRIGSIPLTETVGSGANVLVNLVLLVAVPLVLVGMLPREAVNRAAAPPLADVREDEPASSPTPADRLDRSRALVIAVVIPAAVAVGLALWRRGLGQVDLNLINFAFLFLGLALHGSPGSYVRAVGEAARGCGGIILQFPFYAGIMAILAGTGLLAEISRAVASTGPAALPAVSFYLAGLVNLFVPSGGGQWAVQGPILIEAGLQAGVPPAKMVMALAYGDQWTNMLQPFWALPLLAITGVKARDIVGYTAVVLVISQVPFLIGLYLG